MNKHFCTWLIVLSIVCCSGCFNFTSGTSRYSLKIEPAGQKVRRTIYLSGGRESKRIAQLYPDDNGTTQRSFTGTFGEELPADVGNGGSYVCFATNLGELYGYVERFGGSDDPFAKWNRVETAVDKIVDVIIGWLEMELGQQAGFDKLRVFCDKDLRHDAKNLLMYLGEATIASQNNIDKTKELFPRVAQYLIDQDYFKASEFPSIFGAIEYAEQIDDYTRLVSFIQRLVAKKLDSSDLSASLDFLSTPEKAKESFERYFKNTETYKNYVKKHRQEKEDEAEVEEPAPLDVAGELFADAIVLDLKLFAKYNEVNIFLACPNKPLMTNGKWETRKERGKEYTGVFWELKYTAGTSESFLNYAFWAVADEDFQKQHLGKLVFDGDNLAEYCLWRSGLTEEHGRQWDRFLAELTPETATREKVMAFEFSDNGKTDKLLEHPRKLLVQALTTQPCQSQPKVK